MGAVKYVRFEEYPEVLEIPYYSAEEKKAVWYDNAFYEVAELERLRIAMFGEEPHLQEDTLSLGSFAVAEKETLWYSKNDFYGNAMKTLKSTAHFMFKGKILDDDDDTFENNDIAKFCIKYDHDYSRTSDLIAEVRIESSEHCKIHASKISLRKKGEQTDTLFGSAYDLAERLNDDLLGIFGCGGKMSHLVLSI